MGKRNNKGRIGQMQKYFRVNTNTVAQGTTYFLPAGSRIVAVRGANSGADTYSFKTTVTANGAVESGGQSITYTGVPNGRRVALMRDFPMLTTKSSAPAAAGDLAVSVTAGADSSLEVYYSLGDPLIDITPTPIGSAGTI